VSALSDCYATLTTPFGVLGEYYDALGHRGADYKRSEHQAIVAYDDMIVEYVGHSTGLGTVIGLRRLTIGGYAGYAHTIAPAPVGRFIAKGSTLAQVAGPNDDPGTLWSGPHIHTTESWISAINAALGIRPLNDPAPAIARALGSSSSTAGGGTTPIEEEDMPLTDEDIRKVVVKLLNTPAFEVDSDGNWIADPPTVSEVLRDMSIVYHAILSGGPAMADGGKSISESLAEIHAQVDEE